MRGIGMLVVLAACGAKEPAAPEQGKQGPAAPAAGDVLVTVNGAPIGTEDLRLLLAGAAHDRERTPDRLDSALDTLIRDELIAQRAVELGLDDDPRYRAELAVMQAKMNAFRRDALGELLYRTRIAAEVEVSDADARSYFEEHAERIRTELRVWQILVKSEAEARQAKRDIDAGTPFEQVAARRFPNLPKGTAAPWDLGYLRWKQIPEPWRDVVYDMRPGDVSDVIAGPGDRFWVIELIDSRENPDITFESAKPIIVEALEGEAIRARREAIVNRLRDEAAIERTDVPLRYPADPREEPE